MLTNAIAVMKPEPDSHFLLLPCPVCKSDNVAYVEYKEGIQEPWRVCCFDCGYTVDKQSVLRHDAQKHWNKDPCRAEGKVTCA